MTPVGLSRSIRASLLASSGLLALGALTGILLARALGPEERGELAVVLIWPTVLVFVGGFGLAEAAMYFGARNPGQVREVARHLVWMGVVQGVGLALITAFLIYPLTLGYLWPWESWFATLATLYYPLYFLGVYPMCLANGLGHHRLFHRWRLSPALLLGLIFVCLIATESLTKETAICAYIGVLVVAAVAAWIIFDAKVRSVKPDAGAVSRRDVVSYGWRSGFGTAASTLNERLGHLMVAVFLAPISLGYYTVASTFTSVSSLGSSALGLVGIPSLATLEHDARRAASARLMQWCIGLALVVAVPLLVAMPTLIEVLFGPEFRPATTPARLLVVASVILSVNRTLGTVLRASGRPADVASGEGLGLLITAATLPVTIALWGITGAAVASCIAYSVACLALWLRVSRWHTRQQVSPVTAMSGGR